MSYRAGHFSIRIKTITCNVRIHQSFLMSFNRKKLFSLLSLLLLLCIHFLTIPKQMLFQAFYSVWHPPTTVNPYKIMAPRECIFGQWDEMLRGSRIYYATLRPRCKCSQKTSFLRHAPPALHYTHTSTSYYVKGKLLGVCGQKVPQAFFDSYGNLVRFPARCPPSCSHFSSF